MGCDSIITINLAINNVNTSVAQNGTSLTASANGATYQWIDCNNGNAVVPNATGQTYTATVNGSYAVLVSQNSCTDTSACYTITSIGIEQQHNSAKNFTVYPNPAQEKVTLVADHPLVNASIKICSMSGGLVQQWNQLNGNKISISINELPAGIYFIELYQDQNSSRLKLIKN